MTAGVFLVATGEKYGLMARMAVETLRKVEQCPVTVFCDEQARRALGSPERVDLVAIPAPKFNWNDKIYGFLNAPYEKSIYLDSDILVVRAFADDLAEALDYTDLLVRSDGIGFNYPWEYENYPVAIPQYNTGVVAFRREALRPAIERWAALCEERPGIPDQPTFRAALIETRTRASELPADFNCLPNGNLVNQVRLYHCIKKKHLMTSPRRAARAMAKAAAFGLPAVLVRDHCALERNRPSLSNLARLFAIEIYDRIRRLRKWVKYDILGFTRRSERKASGA